VIGPIQRRKSPVRHPAQSEACQALRL